MYRTLQFTKGGGLNQQFGVIRKLSAIPYCIIMQRESNLE